MKTCEIKDAFGIDALKFSERPDPPLQQSQVRIRVRAVSLNYRDLVTVKQGGARATRLPLIPCSDGAGEAVEVGPGVTRDVRSHEYCRSRTVCGLIFFLSVLQGVASVVYATESPSSEAKTPNQAALGMLAKIAAAGASGQFDTTEQLFRQGKEAGLNELQMYETVLNLLPYIGYPRTLSTMISFQKIYPHYIRERSGGKDPRPTEPWQEYAVKVWGERGAQIQQQLGVGGAGAEELTKQLTLLSPELTEWVRYDDFGRVFGRAGLSLIEREAIVIGVLIAQGAPQIASHHRAMLRVGGNAALIDSLVEAVSGIVDEKAVAAARQYIAKVREQ